MADELKLTLDFDGWPSAEDFGVLFSALGRDYREMSNGRTLVVVRVDRGSIIVTLTDAALVAAPYVGTIVAVAAAVNTLATFAENLKKWFGYAKSKTDKKRLYQKRKKSPGQRAVEAIIKTAADTKSRVRLKYSSDKGETIEAELSPAEALSASEKQIHEDASLARIETAQRVVQSSEIRSAVERLRKIDTQKLAPADIDAIVEVIVGVLKVNGAIHMLPEIASQLEMSGLADIADVVRRHIDSSTEPPISLT